MTTTRQLGALLRQFLFALVALNSVACTKSGDKQPVVSHAPAAAEFVGSASCETCHQSQYSDWLGSDHELAMQHASDSTVLGDFSGVDFDYFGEVSRFTTDNGKYVVRTPDAKGELQNYTIDWVFGVDPLQQYLVAFPGGRLQALPFAWDTRSEEDGGQRWFHLYTNEYIEPGDELHWTGRQQNWNYMCAECHSTNLTMGYDAASDSFDTRYSEVSVGCEACHGPASVHVAEAHKGSFKNSRYGLAVSLDDQGRAVWTMNPATGIADRSEPAMRISQQPESCGRCHSRRGVLVEEYQYGHPLTDTHMPALLDQGLYFADGQNEDEVYVYGSFLQSRMYRAGVTCSNCHNPHSLELVTGPDPNDVCSQCHLPSRFAAEPHTGHPPNTAGCVDCHMPQRTYMVVDERRDHSFRIPRPDLSVAVGVPNTCNACHDDRSAEWATGELEALHGKTTRPEYGTALSAGRAGHGNALLLGALADSSTPGIARATALGLLAPPIAEAEVGALRAGLTDPDPLVRIAALRLHRSAPADFRLQNGTELLADDIRAVRLEAAVTYADMRDALPDNRRADFDKAVREYRAAQTRMLNLPESHVSLGDLEIASGNFPAGFAHYEDALRREPQSVRARVNFADALRRNGDDVRGRQILQQGIALVPDNAALHHSLGLLMVRDGDLAAALEELKIAVKLEPDNARYAYVLDIAESEVHQAVPD
ncbi:MAG TPA: cytochrome c3 family protein [Woeseiaceae bacterium]|nr:cytochrome c3 family protein [Woeseiaceae bacterium]